MTEDMGRTNIYSPIPPGEKEYILVLSSRVFIMNHFSLEWPVFNQYRQEGTDYSLHHEGVWTWSSEDG